jgi:hypothetical protein
MNETSLLYDASDAGFGGMKNDLLVQASGRQILLDVAPRIAGYRQLLLFLAICINRGRSECV